MNNPFKLYDITQTQESVFEFLQVLQEPQSYLQQELKDNQIDLVNFCQTIAAKDYLDVVVFMKNHYDLDSQICWSSSSERFVDIILMLACRAPSLPMNVVSYCIDEKIKANHRLYDLENVLFLCLEKLVDDCGSMDNYEIIAKKLVSHGTALVFKGAMLADSPRGLSIQDKHKKMQMLVLEEKLPRTLPKRNIAKL